MVAGVEAVLGRVGVVLELGVAPAVVVAEFLVPFVGYRDGRVEVGAVEDAGLLRWLSVVLLKVSLGRLRRMTSWWCGRARVGAVGDGRRREVLLAGMTGRWPIVLRKR